MKPNSCFFIGHRDAPDEVYPMLLEAVNKHAVTYGVRDFIVGHYGKFDHLAARAVMEVKTLCPDITLSLLLPYHPAERLPQIPAGFDETFYPSGMENVNRRFAIARANRYVIDYSDYLIAYAWRAASNARNLLEYALRREHRGLIRVTPLYPF